MTLVLLTVLAYKRGDHLELVDRAAFRRSFEALPEGDYVVTFAPYESPENEASAEAMES